jgi:RimJ/RimL family protein N-acetyltransferase
MAHVPLFKGKSLRLTALDGEKDAPIVAKWTYDSDIAGRLREGAAGPLLAFEVRKIFDEWIKGMMDNHRPIVFALRRNGEEDLVGLVRILFVQWVHGAGQFELIITDPQNWQVFAHEALEMVLNYAFDELNLFRVTTRIAEDDHLAKTLYEESRFYLEVRQREALFRNGRYLDRLSFGLLRPEWEAYRTLEVA